MHATAQFPFSIRLRIPAQGIVPHTIRMVFPHQSKNQHKHVQRPISLVILDSVKLTTLISYRICESLGPSHGRV